MAKLNINNKVDFFEGEYGVVQSVRDAVVVVKGLQFVGVNEMVEFYSTRTLKPFINKRLVMKGVVLNLEQGFIKALAFVPDYKIKKGFLVFPTGRLIGFSVNLDLLLVVL